MKKSRVIFCTGGGGPLRKATRVAFTMAEILLSLTIIGVVAAITLPSLTGNINERTWNTQRKALYARFSQAIALMPALNGYGSTADNAAETFVTAGLAKVLKINNICDGDHLSDCGIAKKILSVAGSDPYSAYSQGLPDTLHGYNNMFGSYEYDYAGSTHSISTVMTDTKAAAFETANGESIAVYYNPNCQGNLNETSNHLAQRKMCANFIFDLNGSKGPNTMGKDIGFISVLYSSDSAVVAPMPLTKDAPNAGDVSKVGAICRKFDSESRAPNIDELSAMFYNKLFLDLASNVIYPPSNTFLQGDPTRIWVQNFSSGYRYPSGTLDSGTRCIKR